MTTLCKHTLYLCNALIPFLCLFQSAQGQDTVLHTFIYENASISGADLVSDGQYMYGVRHDGHVNGQGAIFRIGKDGRGYKILYEFTVPEDGINPYGTLVLSGTTLYGMTTFGGIYNFGVVFRLDTNGSGYQKLHDFDGVTGRFPSNSLTLVDNMLYGICQQGGIHSTGTLFRLDIHGNGFKRLFDFADENGEDPSESLTIANGVIYGVAQRGGIFGGGVLYKMNVDGSSFEVILHFNEATGFTPSATLIISDTTLYGTTRYGGSARGQGSVFKIGTSGKGFTQFTSFNAAMPAKITLVNNKLHGMTINGGNGVGLIYSIDVQTGAYQEHHYFNYTDGKTPFGGLVHLDEKLYGYVGGGVYGYGTIFTIDLTGGNFKSIHHFRGTNSGFEPRGSLLVLQNKGYGVTARGGTYNEGVIYTIDLDNFDYDTIHNFNGIEGGWPENSLILSDTSLYGSATSGGSSDSGVLFKLDTASHKFEVIYNFYRPIGSTPSGSLVEGGGDILYGTASYGGPEEKGIVFEFDKRTRELRSLLDFYGTDAYSPTGAIAISDSVLYALSFGGIANGIVFSVQTDGANYKKLVDTNAEESGWVGNSLIASDSVLFVTMRIGGRHNNGVLFSVTKDGQNFKKLIDFSYESGSEPEGAIVESDGWIYGMTKAGGPDYSGVAYRVRTDGSDYEILLSLNDTFQSASGRTRSVGSARTTSGSLAVTNDALYMTVTGTVDQKAKGTIVRFSLGKEGPITSIGQDKTIEAPQIFPNPAESHITLQSGKIKSVAEIIDSSGRRQHVLIVNQTIDVSHLAPGVYYLNIDRKSYRFVKY